MEAIHYYGTPILPALLVGPYKFESMFICARVPGNIFLSRDLARK